MSERTRGRVAALEGALAPEPAPDGFRVRFRERAFADHAALAAYTKALDAARRERRGPDGGDTIRVTVVSIARPGEPVGQRDLGEMERRPMKRSSGSEVPS